MKSFVEQALKISLWNPEEWNLERFELQFQILNGFEQKGSGRTLRSGRRGNEGLPAAAHSECFMKPIVVLGPEIPVKPEDSL